MSEARLRRARSDDIPAMYRIRMSVRENVLSDPARATLQMYEDYLDRDGRGWVAEVDGAVVAFSYADRHQGAIWALFVDPRHEGQGLGKALLALAAAWLFELGHERVRLGTGPATRADRFYQAQGWTRMAGHGADIEYVLEKPRRT